jgi:alpha-galactosidase
MVAEETAAGLEICWRDEALGLRIQVDGEGVARLAHLAPTANDLTADDPTADDPTGSGTGGPAVGKAVAASEGRGAMGLPLLDVVVAGSGRRWSGRRYCESVVGNRMRYVSHTEREDERWSELAVSLEDTSTGLQASVTYQILRAGGALRSRVKMTNGGPSPLTLESVTSFLGGDLAGPGGVLDDADLLWAENDWLAEGRWQTRALRDALPDLNRAVHAGRSRGRFALTSVGSWSSGTYLPMGAVVNRKSGHTLLWQIEHNGAWHWQVGEHAGSGPGSTYMALLGPTDAEHQWRLTLQPGESFETVPVALAFSQDGFEGALASLTAYRRATRRPHQDHLRLPVIFNDYMNTVMGDPSTERLLPLISAAARAGAEYFCIDSGWYAEQGEGWWDTVGAWAPSKSRFPNGIEEVLDHIRADGMVPGLWIEPEVVGVRSPVAGELPTEAFFRRGGERVVEQGRYHLDFSHPRARQHLDKVVHFLVEDLGVGYLKMDYNINIGPGTETASVAAGVGLLAHNRAYLGWLDALLDRHPSLTIESCSSGGMRTDYALLSRCQLHSTSDQQDFLRYAPIAAAAPVGVAPEQAAVWAYPQPEWDSDQIAFTLCSAMLGRVHLSGHVDRMSAAQHRLVSDAISTYKRIRPDLTTAVPFWPLGLPGWTDNWVALGMRARSASYVVVWHRGHIRGAPGTDGASAPSGPAEMAVSVPHLRGAHAVAEILYPALGGGAVDWSSSTGQLTVTLPSAPSACLIGLVPK